MFGDFVASKLWVEEFRPANVEDYVFKNAALRSVIESWIAKKEIPHILLHGPAGTGKTSLINVLMNSIDVIDKSDVLSMNMSDCGMDDIRELVLPFVQTRAFGSYKVVILEEFEQCSIKGQGSLKRIMEEYSDVARFIITSNQPNRILDPIRSRCQEIQIETHDFSQFMGRVVQILMTKGVIVETQEDIDRIEKYVKSCYPDFRKCINTLQQNFVDGRIIDLNATTSGTAPYHFQILEAIQNGNLSSCRKQIVESVKDGEVDAFFTWLYQNVDIWVPNGVSADVREMIIMKAIVKIRDGLVSDTLVSDREMNLAACLVDLQMIMLEHM